MQKEACLLRETAGMPGNLVDTRIMWFMPEPWQGEIHELGE